MSTRPPALRHDEIIAAVAALTERMEHVLENQARMEKKVDDLSTVVVGEGGHADQIKAWRRDGKWIAVALTSLGVFGSWAIEQLLSWLGRGAPPHP